MGEKMSMSPNKEKFVQGEIANPFNLFPLYNCSDTFISFIPKCPHPKVNTTLQKKKQK